MKQPKEFAPTVRMTPDELKHFGFCAASVTPSGSTTVLSCNQVVGHEGPHGVAIQCGGTPYVRWTDDSPVAQRQQ